MCGILATINHDPLNFKASLDSMHHRGPDAVGVFQHQNLNLGHRRLSIQDLSDSANQPMKSGDDRFTIVFNGEIYNHWELRKSEVPDYKYKTSSDTETILALYEKHSKGCLSYLNGIFAFVIFDRLEKTLFVARDPFGVKPLYYTVDNNSFACASELKAILSYAPNQELDLTAIQAYMTFMWCPGSETPVKSIRKLLPGSYIYMDINNISDFRLERYYKLRFPNRVLINGTEDEWIDNLEKKILKAVERQLISDAPIGFFLSGGLDSSLLVAMARKLMPEKNIKCYTIDSGKSKDGFANDLDYARDVARHLNVDLTEIKVQSTIVHEFDQLVWHLDEPQSDPAPFNVMRICEAARKDGIKVLIGGTGGDDIFSGYRRHQALIVDKYFDSSPLILRKFLKSTIQNIKSRSALVRRLKKLTKSIDKDKNNRFVGYFEWLDFSVIQSLFKKELRQHLSPENQYFKELLIDVEEIDSDLNKLLYLEIYTFLVDHNLNYTDKAGMAHGIEIRVPYLDIELVEFSTNIPTKFKMKGRETKYILRKVAEKYLPHHIIYRPKSGFGAPVEFWVRNELKDYIKSSLSESAINQSETFDAQGVLKLVEDNQSGKINAAYSVWSLLAIQSWIRSFDVNGH